MIPRSGRRFLEKIMPKTNNLERDDDDAKKFITL
jgi:hypothetical protein